MTCRPGRRRRRAGGLTALALVAVVFQSCGSSSPHPPTAAATPRHPVLSLRTRVVPKLGAVLVDGRDIAVYLFAADRGRRSTCYGYCARIWPPVVSSEYPALARSLALDKLGLVERRDSRLPQVTYAGHPLYYLARERPGRSAGENYDGTWFLVTTAGHPALPPGVKLTRKGSSY